MMRDYYLKYPYKGGIWHKVRASSLTAAKRKFTKGSTYEGHEDKIKVKK